MTFPGFSMTVRTRKLPAFKYARTAVYYTCISSLVVSVCTPGPWSIRRSSSRVACASLGACACRPRSGRGSWWRTWGGGSAAWAAGSSRTPETGTSPSGGPTAPHTCVRNNNNNIYLYSTFKNNVYKVLDRESRPNKWNSKKQI